MKIIKFQIKLLFAANLCAVPIQHFARLHHGLALVAALLHLLVLVRLEIRFCFVQGIGWKVQI